MVKLHPNLVMVNHPHSTDTVVPLKDMAVPLKDMVVTPLLKDNTLHLKDNTLHRLVTLHHAHHNPASGKHQFRHPKPQVR
jgi:hypothetical protein